MITINEKERQTIINALYVAADVYKDTAARISAESAGGENLASQFSRQRREALAITDKMEREE